MLYKAKQWTANKNNVLQTVFLTLQRWNVSVLIKDSVRTAL
jgi:hypothetical protein